MLPKISLVEALRQRFGSEIVENWYSPALKENTNALKSTKLATFPKVHSVNLEFYVNGFDLIGYSLLALSLIGAFMLTAQYLVLQINKFYADVDWTPKKRGLLSASFRPLIVAFMKH